MSDPWKEKQFYKVYEYFKTYNKIPPTKFKNLVHIPIADEIMYLAGNDPLVATAGVVTLMDLYKNYEKLPISLTSIQEDLYNKFYHKVFDFHWYDYIKLVGNKILGTHMTVNEERIEKVSNKIDQIGDLYYTAIEEHNFKNKSPVKKPRGVTLHYFEDLEPQSQRIANKALKNHNNQFSSDVAREILHKTRVDIKDLNQKWIKWQDLAPIEFYYHSKTDPELITTMTNLDPQSYSILMNYIKMGENAHKYEIGLETRDKDFVKRMQCGVDEAPLQQKIEKCMIKDNPDFKTYVKKEVEEAFKQRQDDLQLIADKDSSNSNWGSILGGAGLITLAGAGAYSAYRLWQMQKLQEKERQKYELEKQRLEIEYQRNLNNIRNKKNQRVYTNVVNTNPTENITV